MVVKTNKLKKPNYLSLYMASPHHKARENVPCGPPAFSAASFVTSFFLKKVFQKVS